VNGGRAVSQNAAGTLPPLVDRSAGGTKTFALEIVRLMKFALVETTLLTVFWLMVFL
jgi:hypothetical protein